MPDPLRSTTADGPPMWIGEHGPTITRADAIEFLARDMEQRRLNAEEFYRLPFEAVEVRDAG